MLYLKAEHKSTHKRYVMKYFIFITTFPTTPKSVIDLIIAQSISMYKPIMLFMLKMNMKETTIHVHEKER